MKSFHTLISVILIVIFIIIGVFSAKANNNTVTERVEKEFVYSTKKNTSEFTVKHKGQVKVTNDDKGIASITPNGYLIIEQSSFGNKRKLEFNADAKGTLSKKYFEGKSEGNFNTEGKEWLESLMPNLIYQTAIGGYERVIRIYNEKGIRAALSEAEKLRTKEGSSFTIIIGTYSQKTNYSITNHNLYYKALIDNVKLSNNERIKNFDN